MNPVTDDTSYNRIEKRRSCRMVFWKFKLTYFQV